MEYRCETVGNVVAVPIDNYVVSVHIASCSHILPRVENSGVSPPDISYCCDRHVIRTPTGTVVVEVEARVSVYPNAISSERVGIIAKELLVESLEKDGIALTLGNYAKGVLISTKRLVSKLRRYGVRIT